MKNLSSAVSTTLSFYYGYVEYVRAVANNEQPKKLRWKHYFSIIFKYGYRNNAYTKLFEITKRHFPKLFVVSGWKGVILELLGEDSKNHEPYLNSLAYFLKDEPQEKRDEFFRALYAGV
jgi:hypothetical protein